MAMEATIFTGWIYDHLLPHAEKVKVAHPLMLRAIAAAKKKNDRIDAGKIADCLRCDFLPECHMASTTPDWLRSPTAVSRPSIKWAVAYRLDHLLAGRPPPGCRPSLINPNRVWPRNT
jgi:hypothetical protein